MSARRERRPSGGSTNLSEASGPSPRDARTLGARSNRRPGSAGSAFASATPRPGAAGQTAAIARADAHAARSTKYVLGVLRDQSTSRVRSTAALRKFQTDHKGRMERRELGDFIRSLNCGIDDQEAVEMVTTQLDPAGEGIEVPALVNHILRLDEWGSHDPLMGATLRSEVADARRSQQRSHCERLAQLKARRALRMATSAKGLHDQMRGASEAFAASAEACTPRAGGPERQAANSSSGAHAARNEKRPFAGTLSREEFQASLGSGAGPFHSMLGTTHLSLAASPLETGGRDPDLGASAYASGGSASAAAMPSDEQLALLAPRSGKRLDVDRFCLSLAYPPPTALGFGVTLPKGDRRPIAPPLLPGRFLRYVPDAELRERVERVYPGATVVGEGLSSLPPDR